MLKVDKKHFSYDASDRISTVTTRFKWNVGYDSHRSCGWRTGNVPAAAVTTFVMESVGGYASIISNGNEILTDKYGVYMQQHFILMKIIVCTK